VESYLSIPLTVLVELHLALNVPAVLRGGVILPIAFTALQGDLFDRAFFRFWHFKTLPYKKIPQS
jgi:hypothetical protein